jgi:sigma-E factor negative regulatory protein RseA
MTMKDKISQLIDQELDPGQQDSLIEQICKNSEAKKCWQRYHLIGSVIRNEISGAGKDLSTVIGQRLENEPTVLSPLSIDKSENHKPTDTWKSVGLFAVAASLTLVAVLTLSPVELGSDREQLTVASSTTGSTQAIQFANEFDEMLVDHAEFTASSGLNGLVAYAKLVSNQQLEQ